MKRSHSRLLGTSGGQIGPAWRQDSSAKGKVYVNLGIGVQRRGNLSVPCLYLVAGAVAHRGDATANATTGLSPASRRQLSGHTVTVGKKLSVPTSATEPCVSLSISHGSSVHKPADAQHRTS